MANKKISELTSATLPLAGTEVVPIVQGGETKKVAVSEFRGDFIPLSGTTVGNPVTGDIEIEALSGVKIKSYLEGDGGNAIDLTRSDEGLVLEHYDSSGVQQVEVLINGSNIYFNPINDSEATSIGFFSPVDFSNRTSGYLESDKLIYAQRQYVDNQNKIATFTIELIDYLTVDFYAPNELRIDSIQQIVNLPSIDILVNFSAYTLGDIIARGDKITIVSDIVGVINLIGNYE